MDRVEQVARAICAADGRDPDAAAAAGPTGDDAPERPPNWHRYRDQAKRIVASFEGLIGPGASEG